MKKRLTLLATMAFVQIPLFAEGEDMAPVRDQGIWQTVSMIGIFLVFFYFILYRPEQKRRQEAEALRSQIKKGDRVTAVGIVGTVVRILDNTLILKMYDGSKIEVLKGAVTDVISGTEEDAKKADKDEKNLSKKIETIDVEEIR
ncbi:MAG: preprotein translocase subunit YajC [Parachlamydiaceae bacterium]|nr:preprotein translocase subunit YajC [Parachlamydiaceae bacterium]